MLRLAMLCVLVLLLAVPALADGPLEEAGQEFPRSIELATDDDTVTLNATGISLRKKLFFKVYVAVSYVDASLELGDDPGQAIIETLRPRQMHLRMLRDLDSEKITNGINEALEKTATRPLEEIAAERERFLGVFGDEKLAKHDDLRMTYLPGKGLEVKLNDEVRDVIPGDAFARAFFEIYFAEKPVDDGMKKNLLKVVRGDD